MASLLKKLTTRVRIALKRQPLANDSDGRVYGVGSDIVKVLPLTDKTEISRAGREQQWLSALKGTSNFIQIKDQFTIGKNLYLIMENGGQDFSKYSRPLPRENEDGLTLFLNDLKQLFTGLLKGLRVLENRKAPAIHGDIKPTNVLFDYDAKTGDVTEDKVKLIDLTRTTTVADIQKGLVTTPTASQYRSPESLGKTGQASAKSDMYAVGLIAFYFLLNDHLLDVTAKDVDTNEKLQEKQQTLLGSVQITETQDKDTAKNNFVGCFADKIAKAYNKSSEKDHDHVTASQLKDSTFFLNFADFILPAIQFDPEQRKSAAESLKLPFFAKPPEAITTADGYAASVALAKI